MSQRTIVVLGGALSGPTAAARARETDEHARILLIERGPRVSYATCGLAYHLSGEVPSLDALDRERAAFFQSVYQIEVWTGVEAVAIDSAARSLTVRRSGQGGQTAVPWDALVFAVGAASRAPETPGLEGSNVRPLRTIDDLAAIGASLRAGRRRVTVLGGGPLGVEAADGLLRGGAEVAIVERGDRLLRRFGRQVSAAAKRALERAGARVLIGSEIAAAQSAGGAVAKLSLATGETVETDFVVAAVGLAPRTELLAQAGAKLAADGTVVVDERARTSVDGIYACGVCVSVPQALSGAPVWWAQGAIADKTAQVAGANAAGGEARLTPALGTMLVRAGDTTVGRTGLSAAEADAHLGRDNVGVTTVHAPTHDTYFPGARLLLVQAIWERSSGRLLGVEVAGTDGVDKRVDAAAAAIAGGLGVTALAGLDFGYAPPYSAARDPLNVAATVAVAERAGSAMSTTPRRLAEERDAVQIVDVRAAGDREGGTLPGASSIALEELRARGGELDRARPVVTVDWTGRRAFLAARILRQAGFADVRFLAGGLASWTLLGLPVAPALGGGA